MGLIGGSPFFSQGFERVLYATLLEAANRPEDALRWYGSFSSNSIFDLADLAPAEVRRGVIAEGLGRREEAMRHYREALERWRWCDAELRPVLGPATAGLARLAASQ